MARYGSGIYGTDTYDSGTGVTAVFTYPSGQTPMFRIGLSDRPVGEASPAPEGFSVYNSTNGKVFVTTGGVWVLSPDPIDPAVLSEWQLS